MLAQNLQKGFPAIFLNFLLQLVSIKIQKSPQLLSGLRASLKDWIQELISSIKSLFDTRWISHYLYFMPCSASVMDSVVRWRLMQSGRSMP